MSLGAVGSLLEVYGRPQHAKEDQLAFLFPGFAFFFRARFELNNMAYMYNHAHIISLRQGHILSIESQILRHDANEETKVALRDIAIRLRLFNERDRLGQVAVFLSAIRSCLLLLGNFFGVLRELNKNATKATDMILPFASSGRTTVNSESSMIQAASMKRYYSTITVQFSFFHRTLIPGRNHNYSGKYFLRCGRAGNECNSQSDFPKPFWGCDRLDDYRKWPEQP